MEIIFAQSKIEEFILKLDIHTISRIDQMIKRLETKGNELRMPHSKKLSKGLFELRIKGAEHIRIIYAYNNNQAVLLHIFSKKRWAIKRSDIEYAQNVLKQYLA